VINVTKTFLPSFDEYTALLKRAWDKGWITNNGELVQELEQKLKDYLDVPYLLFCNNGTVVLQMALKALNITGEVLTTPFSYVATTGAILWENCKPIFVDIDQQTLCMDPDKMERAITERTQAIMATHVYGLPCEIERIEKIANKHGLKVIYDGAHAFGSVYKGKALLSYGDVSTCSFHATKLFHTVEGGCIICKDKEVFDKLFLYRQFGHIYDDYISMGINGKNSEFHAAMGLAIFPNMQTIIDERKKISSTYDSFFAGYLERPKTSISDFVYNFAYYPVIFPSESKMLHCKKRMEENGVFTRRYFYPSLNELPYLTKQNCPVSEDISARVLCLPLYPQLTAEEITKIASVLIDALNEI
jgi:dTDP-4-amino-4,6-dideoxygalactose transaminase